jgi:ABC-type Fe3+-hydroxamate transport system substrate-binding protein
LSAAVAGTGNLAELHLPAAPRRVVSLVPSVTGSLFDLQLGHCLVGVTEYCVYPAEGVAGLPKVGGTKNPDRERIVALHPDLVIANQEENRREDVRALQAAGLPVWVTFPNTAREALNVLWATIRLFDAPQLGRSLVALERAYEVTSQVAENMPAASVFCPVWREPAAPAPAAWWMAANRGTYLHDVLRVCGGRNVFGGRERRYPLAADLDPARPADPPDPERDTRYPRVTTAEVVAAAPQVILLPSEPYPFGDADRETLAALAGLPAVQNERVHLVDGSLLTWPGTRLGQALAELPALLQTVALEHDSEDG